MLRAGTAALSFCAALTGCLPPLSDYRVVGPLDDAGHLPGTDAGMPMVNPIDLGTPCPDPHLLAGTVSGSGELARALRLDPRTGAFCRASELVEVQGAFGSRISDVEWHPATGEILGLYEGVLGLDGEGFPTWRYEVADNPRFRGDWLAVFGGAGGAPQRIAVAWSEVSSSSVDSMQLLDTSGNPTSAAFEPPFFAFGIAAVPDGSGRLILPSRSNDDLETWAVNDATTSFPDAAMVPLYTVSATFRDVHGDRNHVATDLTSGRVVVARDRGIEHWSLGDAPPADTVGCTAHCSELLTAAIDPDDPRGAFAVCTGTTGSRHLVHVRDAGCTIVIDGTSLGSRTLTDVTLVRAPL
jgi:hypothetical protein